MGHFERIRYPDGQISAKYIPENELSGYPSPIAERINSYEDLMYVRAIADIFPNIYMQLFIPCLFGQRSDRKFDVHQSFDLKLITDVINSANFKRVEIFDPHSDVAMALINNSRKKTSFEFVEKAVADITEKQLLTDGFLTKLLLVAPDAGAYKKVFDYGEKLNLPVMGAMKHRDKDGKIDLMFTHDVESMDILIVDDLCDGGYTFEVLGKALKDMKARKVYLYVSHGIFSKGFIKLREVIDHIYCTNSVKDIEGHITIYKATNDENTFFSCEVKEYITQYKVI